MFGISDPLILLPYAMGVGCVVFSVWYGIKNWNKEDKEEEDEQ
ncbi:MAG: hypothetical protein RR386_08560 [Bacteroidaceae bacterium]